MPGFDWDAYFGPMAATLEGLGYDARSASPHERRFVQPSNWKLVLDANLESYHFQYAHRDTIAHLFHDNLVQQQCPAAPADVAAEAHSLDRRPQPTRELGPARPAQQHHLLLLPDDLPAPGRRPRQRLQRPARRRATTEARAGCSCRRPATEADQHWSKNWAIFWDAIDEDFALAASMQRGLASGANPA